MNPPTARVQRGPSQAAHCGSTGNSPGHPSPAGRLFQHLLVDAAARFNPSEHAVD